MRALKWIGGAVLILFVLLALFFTFGLNALRGPIAKAVTNATGRELIIDGNLRPVWSWLHPRLRAERVSFANAEWGKAGHLVNAEAIEATISVLPLFVGRVVLPEVHLQNADVSLEQDIDGRKNWILKQDPEPGKPSRFYIQLLTAQDSVLHWEDAQRDHSFTVGISTDDEGMQFDAVGKYNGMPMKANGRAGQVMALRDEKTPFPIKGDIKIGNTAAKIDGTITGVIGFKGLDIKFEQLSGKSMEELYWIVGLAFPETSPYRLTGRLIRTDGMWRFESIAGKVGESDLAGNLQVDVGDGKQKRRPFMHGDLTAKVLNFADLGPLVGTKQPKESGVLPDMPFEAQRWESVDADVRIRAGTIKRPDQLPLDKLATRIRMRDKVLSLDPLDFGIAGGRLAGTIRLDGNQEPIQGDVRMRVQNLQLAKLFPTVKQAQGSIGDLNGLIELSGRGDSVAKLLGTSNGKIGVYMDEGKISQFLMELIALDLWDAVRVKLRGDKEIDIRCAIADFGVQKGIAQANAFVFDTTVVNVGGSGTINLANEQMDLKLKPQPKDKSIGSLRTPLHIKGTFGQPDVGPDMGKLAAKSAGTILMGVLNPLLAVLPLIEEGKGKDSNCAALIAQATNSTKQAKAPKPQQQAKPQQEATSSGRSAAAGATAPNPPSPPEK